LRDLLLAAPAGPRVVMGLDPGIRTGVKVAVVDATGKLVDTSTVFPHEPRRDWEGSLHALGRLCAQHGVNLIAIGNGTASRETDKLAADLIQRLKSLQPDVDIQRVPRSTAPLNSPARRCRMWMSACEGLPVSPGVCKILWPSW
jgi:uncharacterized protein